MAVRHVILKSQKSIHAVYAVTPYTEAVNTLSPNLQALHLNVKEDFLRYIHSPAVTLPSISTCTSVSYRVLLPQVRCVRLLDMLGNKTEQKRFTPGSQITGTLD